MSKVRVRFMVRVRDRVRVGVRVRVRVKVRARGRARVSDGLLFGGWIRFCFRSGCVSLLSLSLNLTLALPTF